MAIPESFVPCRLLVKRDERGQLVIDEKFHHTPFVKPGDGIIWVCKGPADTELEFTVDNLQFVADLDELFEIFLPHKIGGMRGLESRIDGLVNKVDEAISEAMNHLRELKGAFDSEPRQLFEGDWEPDGRWVDGSVGIRSGAKVAEGIKNGVWMFQWKVKSKSDAGPSGTAPPLTWPAEEVSLHPHIGGEEVHFDPHIVGHEDQDYPP